MGRKAKLSKEMMSRIVREYLKRNKSVRELTSKYGYHTSHIWRLIKYYMNIGESAFEEKSGNKTYLKELKL